MTILIRAGDVPARQRRDAWRSVAADLLGPLDVYVDPDVPLQGEMHADSLGPLRVGRIQTSTPHGVRRTAGQVVRDGRELYRAVLAISGSPRLQQDGRASQLRSGEFAIYDFARPYELAYDSTVQLAVFSFPREMLALPAGSMRQLTAVPITAEGTGALVAPLLRRIAADIETYQPASAARLSTVVMDLITTAVAERIDRTEAVSAQAQQRTTLVRVNAFIEQNLADSTLTPGLVAAAHHVSLRYLHRLFETEHTTVAAWIRQRRLEKCRRDLADPELHAVSVSAIGARWGLPDSAHFSRLFHRTYGLPPVEYRRSCLLSAASASVHG
jgi:AraC-like DNA-binding protein